MGRAGRDYERGGRDKRNSGWGDERGSEPSYRREEPSYRRTEAPAYGAAASSAIEAEAVTGIVKFYTGEKGFGFVGIASKGEDAFLHVSKLPVGTEHLPEGTAIQCTVKRDTRKGGKLAVELVTSIDTSTATSGSSKLPVHGGGQAKKSFGGPSANGPTSKGPAKLVRLNGEKGFGFLRLDSGADVFIHVSVAEHAGIDLVEGSRYLIDYVENEKGLKALAIAED